MGVVDCCGPGRMWRSGRETPLQALDAAMSSVRVVIRLRTEPRARSLRLAVPWAGIRKPFRLDAGRLESR